jgi:hypothetical protein
VLCLLLILILGLRISILPIYFRVKFSASLGTHLVPTFRRIRDHTRSCTLIQVARRRLLTSEAMVRS